MKNTVTAMVITTEGEVLVKELAMEDDMISLATLQGLVGGLIEVIEGPGWHGYCNEEGKIDGLPFNQLATEIATVFGWYGAGDLLHGDVVFFGEYESTEDRDVLEDVPEKLVTYAKMVS